MFFRNAYSKRDSNLTLSFSLTVEKEAHAQVRLCSSCFAVTLLISLHFFFFFNLFIYFSPSCILFKKFG